MKWLPTRRPKTVGPSLSEIHKPAAQQRSLWNLDSAALLELVALPKPVPGGGSVAIMTGCMGTALLRKAFAICRAKARMIDKSADALVDELNRLERILRGSADLDAAGFDYYIRALRLPRSNLAQKKVREKAVEQAMVRATSIPVQAAAIIHHIVILALSELALIEEVVLSDAVAGIRLLNTSACCLLYTAEGNLKKIAHAAFSSMLTEQLQALNRAILEAESGLLRALEDRAGNPSS
jgi:formiminotetrahydrofolate cyclodeaminase